MCNLCTLQNCSYPEIPDSSQQKDALTIQVITCILKEAWMAYQVCYYLDHRNRNPVKEFIVNLSDNERAKASACIKALSVYGPGLKRPTADYLGRGIYELRPKRSRIFYFFFMKGNVVLLHAIKKKTDNISKGDLLLCYKRKLIVELYKKFEKVEIGG
jgi:phage-related protein